MKIVYIAHPISGDVQNNLMKITVIVRKLNLQYSDVIPFVPYFVDCHALDDYIPKERARGIKNDREFFNRKIIDELWLFGNRISDGMVEEIKLAKINDIPIIPCSKETILEYES